MDNSTNIPPTPSSAAKLRILHLEDDPRDAELIKARLEEDGFDFEIERAATRSEFIDRLDAGSYDLIISDYTLPTLNGREALALALGKLPDVPFLFLSGTMGEESVVQALHDGATDYVLKHGMSRLAPAIRRALEESRLRAERHHSEAALRLSEERLRLALEAAQMGTWDWNIRTGSVLWTGDVSSMFGLKKGILERSYDEYLKLIYPADRETVERTISQSLAGPVDTFSVEHRVVHPNGDIRWIEGRGQVYRGSDGLPYRMTGTVADVTRRRQVEEELARWQHRYELIVTSSDLIVYDRDLRSGGIAWSGSIARVIGYEAGEMGGGIDQWRGMIHPTDRDRIERQVNRAQENRAAFELEYRVLARHGSYLWLLDRGFFLEDEHGRATRMLGLLQNISERHRNEQELKDSREQLRALAASLQSIREEERTNIAREIHDELGQALTGMKMDASWLRRHTPDGAAGTQDKITAMIELIDSTIQTVRRIASELRPGVLDNLGLIAAIEWQAQEFQQRTGIMCDVVSNVESLTLDKSHSTALFRIFQETLTNVVRHSNASRVSVRIEAEQQHVMMRIEDNGKGIRQEDITDSRSLGLLGMRERALLLGGTMEIKGAEGQGTVVSVNMPTSGSGRTKDRTSDALAQAGRRVRKRQKAQ